MSDGHPPPRPASPPTFELTVDGETRTFDGLDGSLLDVLRGEFGVRSAKDGCSPQGQCGCCTVLVDGQPRVACVTPARRVKGKTVTTLEGLGDEQRTAWTSAFCAAGASQCGFCTPGIIVRLAGIAARRDEPLDRGDVDQALLAHLCRCTGWQTIHEACALVGAAAPEASGRDLEAAGHRASIEGRAPQQVSPAIAGGEGGFAADGAPADSLVAVPSADGEWIVGETLAAARAEAGALQGRRTTIEAAWPLEVPDPGPTPWAATLRTTWVEPAPLETDASWCVPGGEPASALANGGAFGAKTDGLIEGVARRLADVHGRPVLAVASREHSVRTGPKRPPVAAGVRSDGSGVMHVVRTPGIAEAIATVAPGFEVIEHDIAGPPTSSAIRAAGWAEAAVLLSALRPGDEITAPWGATATATIEDGRISVRVQCGRVLDAVVLRSYCIGAAHMAWSWLTSESLAVDDLGVVHDLTIRSFGVMRAVDTPAIDVHIVPDDGPPVNGSDAVFVAVAAAGWRAAGSRQDWPVGAII